MEARAGGYAEKRNNSHSLALVGRARSGDAFWRKGDFELSIRGRARISPAKS